MPKSSPKKLTRTKTTKELTTRRVKQPTYKTFRLSKRLRQPKPPLKGAFRLFVQSIKTLLKNWRLFGGIVLVYLVLTVVLVKSFGISSNIAGLKSAFLSFFHGSSAELKTSLGLFSILLTNANSTASEVAGAYQSMLLVIISLVVIWALRQSLAKDKVKLTIRDAFYKSLYPLVPFMIVLFIVGLELIPLLLARFLYGSVFSGGLAVTGIEKVLWALFLGLLTLLSFYMITSSIFGLYIVTLPDVRPLQALRSARELVRYRRWMIMRKVLFLPLAIIILGALIVVPIIIISPSVAEWVFFVLSMMVLATVHSYLYNLYRELL